ncbi:MAG: alpha/beta hydrolase, partial [Bacteroidota bacterium]
MSTPQRPKYKLPRRFKFALWIINLVRPPAAKQKMKHILRSRRPFPVAFLRYWILGKPRPIHRVEDRMVPVRDAEIPVRMYWPSAAENLPVIINAHGGGWVQGGLYQCDHYCRQMANEVPAIVISVDYRKAPEHRFPTAINDFYDVIQWASEHAAEWGGDPKRIAVTGDSAGGNLSAAACLMARDQAGPKIALQALIYPATDGTFDYESYRIHIHAPILSRADLHYYRDQYQAQEGDFRHPYFSPYLADNHENLPPAF